LKIKNSFDRNFWIREVFVFGEYSVRDVEGSGEVAQPL
jgi:hypothetical protein